MIATSELPGGLKKLMMHTEASGMAEVLVSVLPLFPLCHRLSVGGSVTEPSLGGGEKGGHVGAEGLLAHLRSVAVWHVDSRHAPCSTEGRRFWDSAPGLG